MKKSIIISIGIFLIVRFSFSQSVIELQPEQSMLITGKDSIQNAVINPYSNGNSIAVIKNKGDFPFFVRIETEERVIANIEILSRQVKEFKLEKGFELYIDTDQGGRAKVKFKNLNQKKTN